MGIQSFFESEVKALGRPQKNAEVYAALDLLNKYKFSTLNIDLIYGVYGQTLPSWLHSVQEAIRFNIDEIFIYPLYVRPLTGIDKLNKTTIDTRFRLYTAAREMLQEAGYEQISMRMFRLKKDSLVKRDGLYSCQEDGMMGMGAGARSYTKSVHYSSEYAVARHHIKAIIDTYIAKSPEQFSYIDYGTILTTEEQERRFVIKSLLHSDGLCMERFEGLFGGHVLQKYPCLQTLTAHEMARENGGKIYLTQTGIDYSDAIGPWLYSTMVKELITEFQLQ